MPCSTPSSVIEALCGDTLINLHPESWVLRCVDPQLGSLRESGSRLRSWLDLVTSLNSEVSTGDKLLADVEFLARLPPQSSLSKRDLGVEVLQTGTATVPFSL